MTNTEHCNVLKDNGTAAINRHQIHYNQKITTITTSANVTSRCHIVCTQILHLHANMDTQIIITSLIWSLQHIT